MVAPADEVKNLKACINDLISLLALPAIWTGREPSHIASTLLDVLLGMLRLDFAYARVSDSGAAPIEMVRLPHSQNLAAQRQDIGEMLKVWLTGDIPKSPLTIPNPIGTGDVLIALLPLGLQDQVGLLVAGSKRADFPTETERLLLQVAANQAAIGLEEARLMSTQRRLAEELDRRVMQRTRELTTVNEELRKENIERKRAEEALRESEQQWREVFEHNPTMYFIVDPDGVVLSVNPFGAEQLGYTVDELIGDSVLKVFYEADREAARKKVAQCLEQPGRSMNWELRKIRKNGTMLWVRETARAVLRANRPIVLVACEDITERKRAEAELAKTEQRLRAVIANAPIMLFALDRSGVFTLSEGKGPNDLGLKPGEVVGQSVFDMYRDAPQVLSAVRRALAGESFTEMVEVNDLVYETHYIPVLAEGGQVAGVNGVAINITERKRAEEERQAHLSVLESMVRNLAESERKLEEAQRLTHVGYWDRDLDTGRITWSDESYRIYGVSTEERILTLDQILELIRPEDRPMIVEAVSAALRGGPRYDVEYRVIRPNGEERIIHSQADVTRDELGRPHRMFGTVQDITERKRGEQRLLAQHTVTRILAEAASVEEATPRILRAIGECLEWDVGALWRVDREAGVLRCVEIWHKQSVEVPEFESASREITFQPGIGLPGRVWLSREPIYILDLVRDVQFPRGRRAPIAVREGMHAAFGFPVLLGREVLGVLECFSREIRQPDPELLEMMATSGSQIGQFIERKRAEQALLGAQAELAHVTRVATLGELATSIGHEINQPLAAVITNANACLRWLAANNVEEARHSAELIRADGHRAGEIIKRIRSLAKKAPAQKDWIDINETIREVIALARSEMQRNNVTLETRFSDDVHYVPLILADRIQLQQVILNLMVNAIEAMNENSDGPRELLIRTGIDSSGHVVVAVRDSGPGLARENLDRLFHPFYTTKPQGMGMGLAICRSIIEAHGGRLWATANDDRGATFHFLLPTGGEMT